MKRKLLTLSVWLLVLAVLTFALAYGMFHYLTDGGFVAVYQTEAGKPLLTELVAELGVLFLFGSAASFLSARILCRE